MQPGPPITSRANARVKALRAALSGRARRPGELAAIEGETLLIEAANSSIPLTTIFVREGSERLLDRVGASDLSAQDCVVLSREVFDSAVETETPQGIAATFAIPAVWPLADSLDLVMLLEAVQDPGNVGALLRSAEAFGVSAVLLTNDCANAWSPKVLRASAGSAFRVPTMRGERDELIALLRSRGSRLLAAVAHGASVLPLHEADLTLACAILIGNEGAGLSEQARAACDAQVSVPCRIESLNAAVAGSTILYEAMRQRLASKGS